jgi:hypothetical protein
MYVLLSPVGGMMALLVMLSSSVSMIPCMLLINMTTALTVCTPSQAIDHCLGIRGVDGRRQAKQIMS